jgi:arylsulfatase
VAVRLGNLKVVRQGLKTKSPGGWEVYDIHQDRAETHNLATTHPEVIQQAEAVLRREVAENAVFPLSIPGVTPLAESAQPAP